MGLGAFLGTVQMCLCVSHGFKSEFLSIYLSHGGITSRSQALHPQSLASLLACAHSAHASNPPARTFRVGGIWYSQYVMKKRSTTRLYRNSALPGPCHLLATSTPCLSSVLLVSASEEPRLNLFSTVRCTIRLTLKIRPVQQRLSQTDIVLILSHF